MGLKWTHKQKINMKLTYTTKQRGQIMQVGHKWYGGLNRNNLKFKLYTTCNLWEKAPLLSLKYTLWLFIEATSKWHFFSWHSQVGIPKLVWLLLSQNFGYLYISQIKHVWSMWRQYLIAFKKIFTTVHGMPQLELIWPLL